MALLEEGTAYGVETETSAWRSYEQKLFWKFWNFLRITSGFKFGFIKLTEKRHLITLLMSSSICSFLKLSENSWYAKKWLVLWNDLRNQKVVFTVHFPLNCDLMLDITWSHLPQNDHIVLVILSGRDYFIWMTIPVQDRD